jgi:hypothetical protein
MDKKRGFVGYLIGLLMPLILVLGGAGLAALGVVQGSLVLIVMGLVVVAAGVLWSVVVLIFDEPVRLVLTPRGIGDTPGCSDAHRTVPRLR